MSHSMEQSSWEALFLGGGGGEPSPQSLITLPIPQKSAHISLSSFFPPPPPPPQKKTSPPQTYRACRKPCGIINAAVEKAVSAYFISKRYCLSPSQARTVELKTRPPPPPHTWDSYQPKTKANQYSHRKYDTLC